MDESLVRFEVHHIHRVEADECHEEPHVRLCELAACDIPLIAQDVLYLQLNLFFRPLRIRSVYFLGMGYKTIN